MLSKGLELVWRHSGPKVTAEMYARAIKDQ